jgi:hypothetical protein
LKSSLREPVQSGGWRRQIVAEGCAVLRPRTECLRRSVWAHPDDQLVRHLADFVAAYNFARRLKTLNGLSPYEFVRKRATSERERPFATLKLGYQVLDFDHLSFLSLYSRKHIEFKI